MAIDVKDVLEVGQKACGDYKYNGRNVNHTKFHSDMGLGYGQPWCNCFVDWCFKQAYGEKTAKKLLHMTGGWKFACADTYNGFPSSAKWRRGSSKKPKIGDLIFFKPGCHHIGFICSISGSTIYYINGNTGSGDEVKISSTTRNSSYVYGFARPAYDTNSLQGTGETETKESYSKKIKVKFTAYYPTDDPKYKAMEGGLYDCKGNRLRPDVENVCAVPNEIIGKDRSNYGRKIKFTSKNNKLVDGKVFLAKDVGGSIVKQGNTYRIDICVTDRAAMNSFPNGTGYAYLDYEETTTSKEKDEIIEITLEEDKKYGKQPDGSNFYVNSVKTIKLGEDD